MLWIVAFCLLALMLIIVLFVGAVLKGLERACGGSGMNYYVAKKKK